MSTQYEWRDADEVEQLVFTIIVEQTGMKRCELASESRLIEDLQFDSLDAIELVMELEDEFWLTVPEDQSEPVGKSIFTRSPMRVADLVEFAMVCQGTGAPKRKTRHSYSKRAECNTSPEAILPFSQFGGIWRYDETQPLWEMLETGGAVKTLRRRSDGMCCVHIPEAVAQIGSDDTSVEADQQPAQFVPLDSYVIDVEPVSVSAFVRFLNSAAVPGDASLVALSAGDKRTTNMQFFFDGHLWRARPKTHKQPVVLVAWEAAKAYSIWAHAGDWNARDSEAGFLPTEAQWEHAAKGAYSPANIQAAVHSRGKTYETGFMPIRDVNIPMGVSDFGLRHMSGTVWQWCRDWYAAGFYSCPVATAASACNVQETGLRSERGGSWVGPQSLCRPSYRRGRNPTAAGRCLGFRCACPASMINALK